jgi:monoamine oxidase
MAALRRLAREHRDAETLGITPETLREERAARSDRVDAGRLSRREVLAGAVATVATLAMPRRAHAVPGSPQIAIVGAGIAGLTAAWRLARRGVRATVYESNGRVGGRMFSNRGGYWADDQVSEWCGELIDSGHHTIRHLAQHFNLPLVDLRAAESPGAQDTFYFDGGYYRQAHADRDFGPVYRRLKDDNDAAGYPTLYNASTAAGQALDAMTVYDWIESRVPGGHGSHLGQLVDTAYAIEYGADTTDQSALNIVYLLGGSRPHRLEVFGASDERYHIAGGNQRLPAAMARELGIGSAIQLGMSLEALARGADGSYQLTFATSAGTRTERADIVLLALPFAVLRDLDLSRAGFDALKLRAIQELGRGRNGKLHLQFRERLWRQDGPWPGVSTGTSFADTGYQNTWEVSRGQAGRSGILVAYSGGSTTLTMQTRVPFGVVSNRDVLQDAQRFLGQIDPVFPGLWAHWNGRATQSLPNQDPNFKLAYSYWRAGQYTAFSGYEAVAQNNVYFAGEHTSIDFQGYMEGGASEGKRAAEEILTTLGLARAPAAGPERAFG